MAHDAISTKVKVADNVWRCSAVKMNEKIKKRRRKSEQNLMRPHP